MKSYIMSLREKVGHRPLIMVGAGTFILNEKNQLLLIKRADDGLWDKPAGSMELGETFEECAKRETFEETGLFCNTLDFFDYTSGEHHTYPNGDEVYTCAIYFVCREYTGEVSAWDDEVSSLKFFDLDSIPFETSTIDKATVLKLKEFIGE